VKRARAQYSEAVRVGRAKFEEGGVEALPFEPASFNKVLTVNTIYFWPSLAVGFHEIHRTLAPGGRAAVGLLPKDRMDRMNMPPEIFTTRSPEEVAAELSAVGFSEIRLERPKSTTPWIVAIGSR
jgi:SAM-dependent methyltransferase